MTDLAQAKAKIPKAKTALSGAKTGVAQVAQATLYSPHASLFKNYPYLEGYFRISIKYIAPLVILLIMLDALGFV